MKTRSSQPNAPRRLSAAIVLTLLCLLALPAAAQTDLKLLAHWDFNDVGSGVASADKVAAHVAVFENGPAISADKAGRTGNTGDRSLDLTLATNVAKLVRVSDLADAFNAAAAGDKVTITWWQKWSILPINSSSFWFVSPSSSGTSRGFQGHVPYGGGSATGGTVYFDSAGCCTATTQRVSGGTPSGTIWTNWNHITYVKNAGAKQVYINGTLFLNQTTGASPLPTDFTDLIIGADFSTAGNQFRGYIDDFAVYGSALSSDLIGALSRGASPSDLQSLAQDTDNDGLPGYWEQLYGFNNNDPSDAALDTDNDGLTNLQEFQKGTNPLKADTDGDGIKDGAETKTGVFVSATNTGTDPLKADTDGDGLSDGVETATGTFVSLTNTGTNPNKIDTDGDLYSDFAEVTLGSNPFLASSIPSSGTGSKLIAYWDFNTTNSANGTLDKANNYVANFINGVVLTADAGGRSGKAGDKAASFGTTASNRSIRSTDIAAKLQVAGVGDQMTVTWWQKWAVVPINSSIVWMASPSSNSGSRGWNVHAPYGGGSFTGGTVYFDTAGCCDTATQRISSPIANLNDPTFSWNAWHHMAVVKNGSAKQIWIDGRIFLEGTSTAPLPTDFSQLVIGQDFTTAGNQFIGLVDDFAVFGSALNQDKIVALSFGVSPQNVDTATGDTDGDGLPDFWEDIYGFNKNDATDAAKDFDNDGLSNLFEFQQRTDPKNPDTDGDGSKDGAEVANGTSPLNPDSDGDGLLDGAETNTGIFVSKTNTGTNPLSKDSDGDLYSDAAEVQLLSNPTDVNSIPKFADTSALLAYWSFDDASNTNQTADITHGYIGSLLNGVVYTADGGGHTGRSGDRAMDFGSTAVVDRAIRVANAQWLDGGGVPDTMSVSLWLKWNVPLAGTTSAFWMYSPTANGTGRGFQAHIPNSDGTMYFDTAGCCDAASQRISANINTFADYTNAPISSNSPLFWTNWHHFTYVKNLTEKKIYIDGKLFLTGSSTGFLPIDFTDLYIGNQVGAASGQPAASNNLRAVIDDFAVYASALDASKVALLAQGASPLNFTFPSLNFRLTSITRSAGSVSLTWQSESGKSYIVQRTADLKTWSQVGGTISAGAGSSTTYSDTTAGTGDAFFYRVQRQ